jgi:hypothetical protein
MVQGRFLLRWRLALCWTLFLVLLAGMAAVLEGILPPQPRWSVRAPLFFHGITPDNRAVITTKRKPVNDSRPPLTALDIATGQELARVFPDAFDINFQITIPEAGKDALVYVQLFEGAPWELHLLNTTTFATRRLPFPVPPATTHFVRTVPKASLAVISDRVSPQNARRDLSLLDYESGIQHTWRHQAFLTEFIPNDHMVFFGSLDGMETKLTFWDRREKEAKTIALGQAILAVSTDQRRAATAQKTKPGQQRVKLWDLASGAVLRETLTEEGEVGLSHDGSWAMVYPGEVEVEPPAPDPSRQVQRAAFWNLREGRRIGDCPWEPGDWLDVITDQGPPRLLIVSQTKSEVHLRDLNTLQTIWARNWPNWDHLYRDSGSARLMREYVAFSNDLERLDLSNGQTRNRVPLAGPRFQTLGRPGRGRIELFEPTVSADGRFAVLWTHLFVNDVPLGERWLAQLRNTLGARPHSNELVQLSVIELASGKLLMQTPNYADWPLNNWQLSPDGQSLVVLCFTGEDENAETILECWDLPARKPWPWIVGIPLAFGLCSWLARRAWLRWRKRGAGPSSPSSAASQGATLTQPGKPETPSASA